MTLTLLSLFQVCPGAYHFGCDGGDPLPTTTDQTTDGATEEPQGGGADTFRVANFVVAVVPIVIYSVLF